MRTTLLKKNKVWIFRFLELQLFITIVSLPILIAWGIPISLLSFAGNLLFSPVFVGFLFLSSIIFFCEILYIPSTPFTYLLTWLTHFWTACLNMGSNKALVGYALQPTLVLCALPICALFFLQHKTLSKTRLQRIGGYMLLLIIFCSYATFLGTSQQCVKKIEHNKKHATIMNDHGHITVIDEGALGRSLSSASWSEYTLLPTIIKETGHTKIDTLILTKPGKIMFDVVEKLCTKIPIKQIYLIIWEGTLPKYYLCCFFKLKEAAQISGITFSRIGKYPITITTSQNSCITIIPEKVTRTSGPFSYQKLTINHIIDNNDIPLV